MVVIYRLFVPYVCSTGNFLSKLHYKKISNIYITSQEGYVLLEIKSIRLSEHILLEKNLTRNMNLTTKPIRIFKEFSIQIRGLIQVWIVGWKKVRLNIIIRCVSVSQKKKNFEQSSIFLKNSSMNFCMRGEIID